MTCYEQAPEAQPHTWQGQVSHSLRLQGNLERKAGKGTVLAASSGMQVLFSSHLILPDVFQLSPQNLRGKTLLL